MVFDKIIKGTIIINRFWDYKSKSQYYCNAKIKDLVMFNKKNKSIFKLRKIIFYKVEVGSIAG
jgi:hypothetical protein